MAADIVTASPRPARGLARCSRNHQLQLLQCARRCTCRIQILALPPSQSERAIDDRRPKEPLSRHDPRHRNDCVAKKRLQGPPPAKMETAGVGVERLGEEQGDKSERRPCPAHLHEVHIEHVVLASKVVYGGVTRRRGVRCRQGGRLVGGLGRARSGRDDRVEGAHDQSERIDKKGDCRWLRWPLCPLGFGWRPVSSLSCRRWGHIFFSPVTNPGSENWGRKKWPDWKSEGSKNVKGENKLQLSFRHFQWQCVSTCADGASISEQVPSRLMTSACSFGLHGHVLDPSRGALVARQVRSTTRY